MYEYTYYNKYEYMYYNKYEYVNQEKLQNFFSFVKCKFSNETLQQEGSCSSFASAKLGTRCKKERYADNLL